MPPSPLWTRRLREIIRAIQRSDKELIDRTALQSLLGVGKTEAWTLMRRWGASQVGTSLVIGRGNLLRILEAWPAPRREPVPHKTAE